MLCLRPMNRVHRIFAVVLCLLGGVGPAMSADPSTNKTSQPDRWLLVVDTSAAMERRGKAVEGVIGELLVSGMRGEMKPGSEIGLWLFNKELSAGIVPLQNWDPAKSNLIAGRTVNFLAAQKFTGKARIEPVIEELRGVVGNSRRLTVLLFTDGATLFTNTPIDAELNAAIAANKASLAKTRMPLVVVLRGEKGKLIGHNVSLAPWPVEFPPFAPEPAPFVAKVVPPPTNRPPREIHITGKPKPEPVVLTNAAPVAPTNPPPVMAPKPEPVEPTSAPVVQPAPAPTTGAVAAVTTPSPAAETNTVAPAKPPVQPPVSAPVVETPAAVPVVTTPPSSSPSPVVEAQVPMPEPASSRSRWPLYAGIGFMTMAALLALFLVLRSRRSGGSSLITRSFDRQ